MFWFWAPSDGMVWDVSSIWDCPWCGGMVFRLEIQPETWNILEHGVSKQRFFFFSAVKFDHLIPLDHHEIPWNHYVYQFLPVRTTPLVLSTRFLARQRRRRNSHWRSRQQMRHGGSGGHRWRDWCTSHGFICFLCWLLPMGCSTQKKTSYL